MKTATGNNLLRAYNAAAKVLSEDDLCSASQQSAGFIIPSGQPKGKRKGYQVFVKVCRYSEELLLNHPDSGGLYCERAK